MRLEYKTSKGSGRIEYFEFGTIFTIENIRLIYEGKGVLKLEVEDNG